MPRIKHEVPKMVVPAGSQYTEEQINTVVEFFGKHGYIPGHRVICVATGKQSQATGPWLRKKVAEFGGIREFLVGYKAKKGLKKAAPAAAKPKKPAKGKKTKAEKPVKEKKERKPRTPKTPKEPKQKKEKEYEHIYMTYTRTPLSDADVVAESKVSCMRPDIFLTNGRHCDGCPVFDLCENEIKALPVYKPGKEVKIKSLAA